MKKTLFNFLLATITLLMLNGFIFASETDVDTSFFRGVYTTDQGFNDSINDIEIQSDGKIIFGGRFTGYQGNNFNGIVRLNSDGSIDSSFNIGSGFNSRSFVDIVKTIEIQSDGKILLGGNFTSYSGVSFNRIIRLNSDGSIDNSFNIGSGFNGEITEIKIQDDGKIFVGGNFTNYNGTSRSRSIRLNTDGSIDTSFTSPSLNNPFYTAEIEDGGKILIGGGFFGTNRNRILRLNSNGSTDTSFNIGSGFNNIVLSILQHNGKFLVGGSFTDYNGTNSNYIIRLNSDGSIDTSFDIGSGFNGHVKSITIDNNGKFLVGGYFTNYNGTNSNYIIRLNSDGSIDTSFDIGSGFGNNGISSIKIQEDNKLIVGGYFYSFNGISKRRIARLNSDGSLDISFNNGEGFPANTQINCITIQDNNILVGGTFTSYKNYSKNRILRMTYTGAIDNSFEIGSGFNNSVNSIIIDNNGKFLVGGGFTDYNGTAVNRLIRLNSDGSIDSSFNIGSGFNGSVESIIIDNNGKFLVGGNFSDYNGTTVNRLVRLNSDGSIDSSFNIGSGFNSSVRSIIIDNNGKFLVGGGFTDYNGTAINRIARLNSDGSIDTSFNIGIGFNNQIYFIKEQSNGKILVGGRFTSYNGTAVNRLVRLNSDGSIDSSFNIGGGFNNSTFDSVIQADNKILVGGSFTSYNGTAVNRLVRLNSDGSIDSSFYTGNGIIGNYVYAITINSNGKPLIGGNFWGNYMGKSILSFFSIGNYAVLPNSLDDMIIQNAFLSKGFTINEYDEFVGSNLISFEESNGLIPKNIIFNNENNKVEFTEGTQLLKNNNEIYDSTITPPRNMNSSEIKKPNIKGVISSYSNTIKVGSLTEHINISGGLATLKIATPEKNIGDTVNIYTSQDQYNWQEEQTINISSENGQPYAIFDVNHFSYFMIGEEQGEFLINSGATSTPSTGVTLNITTDPGLINQMRFSNTNNFDGISWVTYSSTHPWMLSEGNGTKTVYAQFDFNGDGISDIETFETITFNGPTSGNITLTITGGITECVYGTSLYLGAQDVNINPSGYTFSGDFSPSSWYCADFKGFDGWAFSIHTSDLSNEKSNIISGSNVLISHNPPVVQGHDSCTGYNGAPTSFNNGTGLVLMEKSNVPDNKKICRVDISDVKLEVNVPPYQAPGNYSGTLTITIPNGFNE